MTGRPSRPAAMPHVFREDPQVPRNHAGLGVCAVCHKLGRQGDAQHPEPADTPADDLVLDAAREVDQRRLGEAGQP